MGSSTGRAFRVTTFGESHGGGLGVVVDGCPPGLTLDLDRVQAELDRRRPGQSKLVTQRKETDTVEVLSGLFEGQTLGTPLGLVIRNKDADPRAYAPFKDRYRPSHADFTYDAKFGLRAWAGGGRASARETAARVAAGAVARQVLEALAPGIEIVAWVDRIQDLQADVDAQTVNAQQVDATPVRCPDPYIATAMIDRIAAIRKQGDTIGGIVRAIARGVPAGLGEPVFDKLDAELAKAMISLPAAKGFELGSGFAGTELTGTAHNDVFVPDPERGIGTTTNHSGGIQGGISNGMPLTMAIAFKPVATVFSEQPTVNRAGEAVSVRPKGRHDPCVLPRAVPIVESMIALVLVDHLLRWRGQVGTPPPIPVEGREPPME